MNLRKGGLLVVIECESVSKMSRAQSSFEERVDIDDVSGIYLLGELYGAQAVLVVWTGRVGCGVYILGVVCTERCVSEVFDQTDMTLSVDERNVPCAKWKVRARRSTSHFGEVVYNFRNNE